MAEITIFVLGDDPMKINTNDKELTLKKVMGDADLKATRSTKFKGSKDGKIFVPLKVTDKVLGYKEIFIIGKISGA